MDKRKQGRFHVWVENGPVDNFLVHSKTSHPDGSFDYLCQSVPTLEYGNALAMHLSTAFRKLLEDKNCHYEALEEQE
jgi:hypothetical protein